MKSRDLDKKKPSQNYGMSLAIWDHTTQVNPHRLNYYYYILL